MNVTVVMPALNVARTLEKTYNALPPHLRHHVLLGDNQSTDGTAQLAARLGIEVMSHQKNYGYGGNLKRLFRRALAMGADIIVELHPDFQYDPSLTDILVAYIQRGYFDVMQGNRIRSRDEAFAGGMPWYRYLGNRTMTLFENFWFGLTLGEWHSGMKAFRADVLQQLPLDSYPDTHAFASDILMDCVMKGFRVGEIPIPVRYENDSSSVGLPGLFAYTLRTVASAMKRPPWKRRPFGSAKLPSISEERTAECEETVRCPVCHATAWEEMEPDDTFFCLFRCRCCDCCRIDEERPPLALLYNDYYVNDTAQRLSGVFQFCWRLLRRWKAQRILHATAPNARVCDIGCERGELLHVLQQHGRQVVGTQLSPSAADFARQRFGIDVFIGEIWAAPFAHHSFDAVLMINVLEHLPHPEAYLAHVRRMLRSGGTFWVEVPNAGSWTARLCGKRWLHHDPDHHLWSFTAANLAALLSRYGFTIECVSHVSWEHGPIGCVQSWLNFLPGPRNVLFRVVREGLSSNLRQRMLQALHVALTICLLPAACLVSFLESAAGNGQIILVKARTGAHGA